MKPLPTKTGLLRLDTASWEKGFSDGFREPKPVGTPEPSPSRDGRRHAYLAPRQRWGVSFQITRRKSFVAG
jgi:hypothetical protein